MAFDHVQALAAPRDPRLTAAGDQLLAVWRAQARRMPADVRAEWVRALTLVADYRDQQIAGVCDLADWARRARAWPAHTYGAIIMDIVDIFELLEFPGSAVVDWLGKDTKDCMSYVILGLLAIDKRNSAEWGTWTAYVETICEHCRVNVTSALGQLFSRLGIDSPRLRLAIDSIEYVGA